MILQFKAKPEKGQILPALESVTVVDCPKQWTRAHVTDAGKVSGFINSSMLHGAIMRELKRAGIPSRFDVKNPPSGVTIDATGFLSVVTIKTA